jgi:hypothetical protein
MFMNPLNQYATVKVLCRWPVCPLGLAAPLSVFFVQRRREMIPDPVSEVNPLAFFFKFLPKPTSLESVSSVSFPVEKTS